MKTDIEVVYIQCSLGTKPNEVKKKIISACSKCHQHKQILLKPKQRKLILIFKDIDIVKKDQFEFNRLNNFIMFL